MVNFWYRKEEMSTMAASPTKAPTRYSCPRLEMS